MQEGFLGNEKVSLLGKSPRFGVSLERGSTVLICFIGVTFLL